MLLPSRTRLLPLTLLLAATTASAQMHRVEAPEKVTRSVGVYEWTGDIAKPTAARLIPVSLFIDAQYQDGGTYYARPVPLALENGNIYSLEKAGVPQGSLTLDFARHLQSANGTDASVDLGWFGYGTYATMPAEKKSRPLRVSASLPKITSSTDKDDDRPTFRRNADEDNPKSKDKKKSDPKTPDPKSTTTPTRSAPPDADDPDRPRFGKKPADTSGSTPSTTTTSSTTDSSGTDSGRKTDTQASDPSVDSDRPTLKRRDPKQAAADARKNKDRSSVSSAGGSPDDDPDRPNMRHGKTAGIGGDPSPQLKGLPTDIHQLVAVSDPTNRDSHPFTRAWGSPAEQTEITNNLAGLARAQLAIYNRSNGSAPAPATKPATKPAAKTGTASTTKPTTKPATHSAAAHRTVHAPTAPPALPLIDEQVTGYTLSYGGLPTFVYTASSPAPGTTGPSMGERYITLVAQQLPSGEMQLAFATVTDAQHLDRTPWFRLVDAVDPDAAHRASILFELRGHSSRQFALYRILSAKAEELFITHVND